MITGLAPEKASRIRVGDVGACTENRSLLLIPEPIDCIIGDPDNFRGSVRLGIGTIDRATRSGMEPVVNSTVKISRKG